MSDALPLPPRPNLEQYKKLARDLQHACKSSDPVAVRQWATHWVETLGRLYDKPVRGMEAEQIERRWRKLKADCALSRAQFFIAREYGFTNWTKFASHVEELARAHSPVSAFEAAADAIVDGDAATLRQLLADHPGLARERSTRDHRSTLLHYVSANGIEDFRQKTPPNIVEIANLLLDVGSAVDAESDAYGGGCTTLGLVATSVHPEQAGVQIALLQTLLDRGARLDHPSSAGNRHSIVRGCIANGQPAAGRFLADLGAPLNAESAAAVGRLDVLQNYFDDSGALRPGTDRKEVESGLLYACGYGRLETATFLLDRGIDPSTSDNDGQTALHWAAWTPQVAAIRLLLERGATIDAKDFRYHATPLDTVLWTWNKTPESQRDDCYRAIALLARAGAKLDRDHWRDPVKENSTMLDKIDADPRMLAALRGDAP